MLLFTDDGAVDLVKAEVGLDGRDVLRLLGLPARRSPQSEQEPEVVFLKLSTSGHAHNYQCR